MGAPSASVFLPAELTTAQRLSIDKLLDQIGTGRGVHNNNHIWIEDTSAIGGKYSGEGLSMFVCLDESFDPKEFGEQEEIELFVTEFRFDPVYSIEIFAGCKAAADDLVVAELCHCFASMFDGIIYFGGALEPPGLELGGDEWSCQWAEVEPHFLEWVSDIPGKIISFPYQPTSDRTWVSHCCTPEFLAAWITHPDFYMLR